MPWNVSKHVSDKRRTACEVGVVPVSKTKGGEHGSLDIILDHRGKNVLDVQLDTVRS